MSNAFNKFNQFVADIANKAHNLGSDSLKILLTNTAPNAADTVVDTTTGTCTVKSTSNAPEITAEHNYSKGGRLGHILTVVRYVAGRALFRLDSMAMVALARLPIQRSVDRVTALVFYGVSPVST